MQVGDILYQANADVTSEGCEGMRDRRDTVASLLLAAKEDTPSLTKRVMYRKARKAGLTKHDANNAVAAAWLEWELKND